MPESRVLTAVVLIPLFIFGVLKLPALYFSLLVTGVVLAGSWEWARLAGQDGARQRLYFVAATLVLMAAVYYYRHWAAQPLAAAACVAWLAAAVALWRRRAAGPLAWPAPARWAAGQAALVPAWLAVCLLQARAPYALLLLFVLIWSADSAAYFVGRRLGRRGLAPMISPGKTVEGLWGALASVLPVVVVFAALLDIEAPAWPVLLGLSLGVVLMSAVGDLFESNWKRLGGFKDSGAVLPGHGGVLDRIDSMTAAAPFFMLGWLWWFGSTPA